MAQSGGDSIQKYASWFLMAASLNTRATLVELIREAVGVSKELTKQGYSKREIQYHPLIVDIVCALSDTVCWSPDRDSHARVLCVAHGGSMILLPSGQQYIYNQSWDVFGLYNLANMIVKDKIDFVDVFEILSIKLLRLKEISYTEEYINNHPAIIAITGWLYSQLGLIHEEIGPDGNVIFSNIDTVSRELVKRLAEGEIVVYDVPYTRVEPVLNGYTPAEVKLITYFGYADLLEHQGPTMLYRLCLEKAFLNNMQGSAVDALRRVTNILFQAQCGQVIYRNTVDFENLATFESP